ncbi:XRE family transcriptional regulator [Zhihengliuella sp.]|uniref:helix-turn-helix domain-containing protein n=1 Tax=Zhihengliuella sp. TaxID=1954483 RepID=UPI002812261E|nr:XRE family transcriptional regulator [Zhihengliuella sp.]
MPRSLRTTVPDNQEIAALIAQRVRGLRASRAWTLDDLAARSGVSRRTLVMIEQGQANPSIAVLSSIADALGVAFVSLVELGAREQVQVVRAGEGARLWEGNDGGSARLAGSLPGTTELWEFRMSPGEEYLGSPHPGGTKELVHVSSGELTLNVVDRTLVLGPGDAATHPADVPHGYRNEGSGPVVFSNLVQYPTPQNEQ